MRRWLLIFMLATILTAVNWSGLVPWADELNLPAELPEQPQVEQPASQTAETSAGNSVAEDNTDSQPVVADSGVTEQTNPAGTGETLPPTPLPETTAGEERIVAVSEDIYDNQPDTVQVGSTPEPPTGLTAVATGPNTVELSWNGITGDDVLYQVYMAKEGNSFNWLKNVTTTGTTATDLMPLTTYNFYVQQVVQGQISPPGEIVTVTTQASSSPPMVTSKKPTGTGVKRNERVEVVWNDWLDPATITPSNFYVTVNFSGVKLPGKYAWDEKTRTMYFTPAQPWSANTSYKVVINSGIKSTSGLAAGFTSWVFTTINSPFVSPHGNYLFSTAPCALCHSAHAAGGSKLIINQAIAGLCLSCHDGSGSVVLFFDAPQMGHGLDSNCCVCHNPHRPKP